MKTPRTDQMESTFLECETSEVDDVFVFARNLEIELNEAENRIKLLEAANSDVARISAERDRANERIKRLEEVENRLLNWLTEDCPESVKKQISNAWAKAKEAKP